MRRLKSPHLNAFFFAGIIVVLVLFWAAARFVVTTREFSQPIPANNLPLTPSEKTQIEAWIKKEHRNTYGDSLDTVYAGGTPLFNETTGQHLDRFAYIIQRHPDRPWKK